MALKYIIAKEEFEALDDGLKEQYAEGKNGTYELAVEGVVEKKKLEEFRTNNIKLQKDLEKIQKQFADVDLEEVKEMRKKIDEMNDKKMIDAGKIDELVDQKVERMRSEFEGQTTALTTKATEQEERAQKAESRLASVLIDSEVTKAVTAVGNVKQGALEDILVRGRKVWQLIEGKPTPMAGDKVMYGKDGQSFLTFNEWAEVLQKEAPFLFEDSGGSGGAGSGGRGGGPKTSDDMKKLPASERLKEIHRRDKDGARA